MRIISGKYKGRRLSPPSSLPVRPTTDFAKEGLFNILNNLIDFGEIKALDLFAGTGNITYELASRGCPSITSVDVNFRCVKYITETAKTLEIDSVGAIKSEVFSFIENRADRYDFIFADPPYDMPKAELLPDIIFENELLSEGGLLIFEHSSKKDYNNHPRLVDFRSYGNVGFSFFK